MQFDFIVAIDSEYGLAKDGDIPWKNTEAGREDMKWFKTCTCVPGSAVIMGRKTWEAIPDNYRPLPGRINVVISRSNDGLTIDGALTGSPIIHVNSLESALKWCAASQEGALEVMYCMVIGGLQIYNEALRSPYLNHGYVTKFKQSWGCDVKFPIRLDNAELLRSTKHADYYEIYYGNKGEMKYLALLKSLMSAPLRKNRTGVPTRGLFHKKLSFRLHDPQHGNILPLLTTKKVIWKSVYHENIWFMRGDCTDISYLKEHGVRIWDGNSTREFLDKYGLKNYEPGEIGPVYGYQWRKWNRPYTGEEKHGGIDQIANVIHKLKTDPWDRRMIVSAWNVGQLHEMALPPCHYAFQFHVDPDKDGEPRYLNCLVNMRSSDVALGVPFNVASYAFITHVIAWIVGMTPGKLSISMADCHIYVDHEEGILEQLSRTPLRFPTLEFGPKITSIPRDKVTIDDFVTKFTIDDYVITGYEPAGFIKMKMAV